MRCYRTDSLAILLLVAGTWVAFGHVCGYDFVNYDDGQYVTQNHHVQAGLTYPSVWWSLTTFHFSNWHPLTWLSYQLDYELWMLKAGGYHLTNLLLHTANAVLLFGVLRRMTEAVWRSFFVAALFAVHPLHVESVAWVSERKDVLSTLFGLLALGAYVWHAERPWLGRYLLVVLAFALGLMAKPMLVTLPCLLLLLDYWPLRRWLTPHHSPLTTPHSRFASASWGWLLAEKVPLFLLAAASSGVTLLAQSGALNSLEMLPLGIRLENALTAYVAYLGKTVWPANLAAFYPYPHDTLPIWQVVGAGVLLVGISVMVLGQVRRRPYLLVGWLWYLGMLVPVIGLVQVGSQSMADRYTYVPLIGVFLLSSWGIADLRGRLRWQQLALGSTAGVVLGMYMVCTWLQVQHWRDSSTLWKHALQVTTKNYVAHYCLGGALEKHGKLEEAERHFATALEIKPNYVEGHDGMGIVCYRQGKLPEAIYHFSVALVINPNFHQAHNNFGILRGKQGDLPEAMRHFSAALKIHPDYAEAHSNLGVALGKLGHLPEAVHHLSTALEINPKYVEALDSLGVVFEQQGKLAEAMEHYSRALQLDPNHAPAHNHLGVALGGQGKLAEAVHHFSEAVRINSSDAEAHHNLGVTLWKQGKWTEAVDLYQQAVQLQPRVVQYRCSLGAAFYEQGQVEVAQEQYREVLRLEPNWAQTAQQTAWTLATHPDPLRRHGIQALQMAQQLCQATQNQRPECLDTLAAAYAETGRFHEAVAASQKALALVSAMKQTELAQQIQARLRLYQRQQPFREER